MTAPTKIGKYEIRRQIGRGAMGVVYEGFDPIIERRVAVKTLRLELFDPSQIADLRTRFKREAQAAGQLAHPHIVTIHEYGDHEGTPYIAMEFLAGDELSKILRRGSRLPLSEIVRLMTQLLGALTYAHEHKVVHRDIKPGNIFILDDGSLKVVDFGIAHVEASDLTNTGAILGTPAYMSPEQFLAMPVDERSDIFAAGVILYELLTGDQPFTGSVTTIPQKVLHQEPVEPSMLNPMLSAAWDTVVNRAMAKKPEARFQSARQFSETIKQVFDKGALNSSADVTLPGNKADDLGGETRRLSPVKQQVSKAPRPVPPASAGPDIEPGRSSSKKGLAIAVLAFVVAGGGTTFYLSQRPHEEPAKPGPAMMTAQIEQAIMKAPTQEAAAKAETVPKAEANAPRTATRSEREAQRDAEAAVKAVGKPAAQVAVLSPSVASTPGAVPAAASAAASRAAPAADAVASDAEAMYQQALALEGSGKAADAVRIYRRAARAGHGKSARRLGDIFDRGVPGVSRDYAESLQWYQTARALGESVEISGKR